MERGSLFNLWNINITVTVGVHRCVPWLQIRTYIYSHSKTYNVLKEHQEHVFLLATNMYIRLHNKTYHVLQEHQELSFISITIMYRHPHNLARTFIYLGYKYIHSLTRQNLPCLARTFSTANWNRFTLSSRRSALILREGCKYSDNFRSNLGFPWLFLILSIPFPMANPGFIKGLRSFFTISLNSEPASWRPVWKGEKLYHTNKKKKSI